jgi:hypothetical protein
MVVGAGVAAVDRRVSVTSGLGFGASFEELLDEHSVRARPAQDRDRLRGGHPTALGWRDDPQPIADPPDDKVVMFDLDGLAGLHDRAAATGTEGGQERGPGS